MSEWQPIETAPLDDTWILLSGGTVDWAEFAFGITCPPVVVACRRSEEWIVSLADSGYMLTRYREPTHWMPLPATPFSNDAPTPISEETLTAPDQSRPYMKPRYVRRGH
ncbi:DUF551 domain-containing protein [Methylobacterium durans]|uniref:DUF551 domain-containing protein n=1 Tax=Methylobacterium durans TaxID=2202825 RepID=A0A2U8W341_9HYPH|nr:hypothetical protein DK389_04540 [Methylobacterium durans]